VAEGSGSQRVRVAIRDEDTVTGTCVRFSLVLDDLPVPAFAVLTSSGWRAFVDRCRHLPIPLDPGRGDLSVDGGRTLICSRHDATYDAIGGGCLGGPCEDRALLPLQLEQRDGEWWCLGRALRTPER